jgi:hypothetical protein
MMAARYGMTKRIMDGFPVIQKPGTPDPYNEDTPS